jgi:hypothetical protein
MVSKRSIVDVATEHKSFFEGIISSSMDRGDRERAQFGLEQAQHLLEIIKKSKAELTSKELKSMYAIFMNMGRGVEYFEDLDTETKFGQLGAKIPPIQQEIRAALKW